MYAPSGPSGFDELFITGGTPVDPDLDPIAQVTVAISTPMGFCTGVLIFNDTVLTAAHCAGSETKVFFGNDISQAIAKIAVTRFMVQPGFDREGLYAEQPKDLADVAVLHLDASIPAGFHGATKAPANLEPQKKDPVVLAGFGRTLFYDEKSLGKLNKVAVPVYDFHYSNTEFQIDASLGKSDCAGDSGGPAFVMQDDTPVLIGLDSWGMKNCDQLSVFTKVNPYWDWILKAANQLRNAG